MGRPAEDLSGAAPTVPLTVIRSANRRKTVSAKMVEGRLVMRIPARMSAAEERRWAHEMTRRFAARHHTDRVDLTARASALASRHGLPRPASIRWVANQQQRWGSCTVGTADIRLSDRLADFPGWVIDYVIVHELAHLVVAGHGPQFDTLVNRYPRAERARGFLIAKSGDEGGGGDPDTTEGADDDERGDAGTTGRLF